MGGTKNLPWVASGRVRRRDRVRTGNRQQSSQPKGTGRTIQKPKGKGKGKGEFGGKAKGFICDACGGIGHPARLCSSDGWVNDLEEDTIEGEDTDEDGCWTEEDETL